MQAHDFRCFSDRYSYVEKYNNRHEHIKMQMNIKTSNVYVNIKYLFNRQTQKDQKPHLKAIIDDNACLASFAQD